MRAPAQGQVDGLLGALDGDVDVGLRAAPVADHRGEMEDRVHLADLVAQIDQMAHVADHHPYPLAPLRRHQFARHHQGHHADVLSQQLTHQMAADEAAGASDECTVHLAHAHSPTTIRLSQVLPSAAQRAR
ncbi:hypothetical protein D3C76_1273650 [compost metagenome]